MSEIKLNMRYPESRLEDVTDAYMRGFEVGLAMRTDENAKLRELIHDMNECIEHSSHNCDGCSLDKCKLYEFNCRMRELGVEV